MDLPPELGGTILSSGWLEDGEGKGELTNVCYGGKIIFFI